MEGYIPDPDELLAVIQKDEARHQRAKQRIFFAMAAGGGKTYMMRVSVRQLNNRLAS